MNLCSSCQAFDIHSFAKDADHTRGYRYKEVVAAAKEGCRFCFLLYQSTLEDKPQETDWLHLQMSEDYTVRDRKHAKEEGLRYNKLRISTGRRYRWVRKEYGSPHYQETICRHEFRVLADSGKLGPLKERMISSETPILTSNQHHR